MRGCAEGEICDGRQNRNERVEAGSGFEIASDYSDATQDIKCRSMRKKKNKGHQRTA
jgi:hypothetical protein